MTNLNKTKTEAPRISVIMPVFNSERYLEAAIDSVRQQSFDDWELIVVDGGSTDSTSAIVANVALNDSRIKFIINENDRGPAHARATGVLNSGGEFIAFLDGDDIWLPLKLEEQLGFMLKHDCKFCYTKYCIINSNGANKTAALGAYRQYDFYSALALRGIATTTVVIHRSLLTNSVILCQDAKYGEDYLWWLLILRCGVVAKGVMKPLALYRDTVGSRSKHFWQHQKSIWRIYREILKIPLIPSIFFHVTYITDVVIRRVICRIQSQLSA
jgi:teichuronic acid biosynthesis glycosyltransferase TuaG